MEIPISIVLAAVGLFGSMAGFIVDSTIKGSKSAKNEQRLDQHDKDLGRIEKRHDELVDWLRRVDDKADTTLIEVREIKALIQKNGG